MNWEHNKKQTNMAPNSEDTTETSDYFMNKVLDPNHFWAKKNEN